MLKLLKFITLFFVISIVSYGCAIPHKVQTETTFDENLSKLVFKEGLNHIEGNAFIVQAGGNVITCAGRKVMLFVSQPYSDERINTLYENTNSGSRDLHRLVEFEPPAPQQYHTNVRKVLCNSDGRFVFDKVADGEYYITVQISWQSQYGVTGANLMHKVKLSDGDNIKLTMTY